MGWFLIALVIASFIYTRFFAPKPNIEDARPGKLDDIRFPRATAGAPIPMIYGKVRLRSPNTAWFGNFKSNPMKKNDQVVGYQYFLNMDLALCLGPDVTLHQVFAGKKSATVPITLNGNGVTFLVNVPSLFGGPSKGGGLRGTIRYYSGGFTQSRNVLISGLATNGADLPGYVGVAHVVFENNVETRTFPIIGTITTTNPFYIGTQATMQPLSFVLSRYPDGLGLGANRLIGDDLNPAEIIYSLLTDQWGGLGLAAAEVEKSSFTAVGTTLKAESNGASLIVSNQNDATGVLEEILTQVDGILFQDPATGKINMRLVREDYVIGTLPVFDETNVESVDSFSRSSWSETSNQIRLIYNSRAKRYSEATAIAQDGASISAQGRVNSAELNYPAVTTEALATALATRELAYRSVPMFRATLRVTRAASALRPGDPFVFSWARFGLSQVVMRVQRFDFGELINGSVVLDCVQDKFAVAATVYAEPPGGLDDPGEITALDIVKYNVFEAPYHLLQLPWVQFPIVADSSYIWALARDPSNQHDGFDFVTSLDNFVEDIVTQLDSAFFLLSAELMTAVHRTQAQDDGILTKIVVQAPYPNGDIFGTQSAADIRTAKGLFIMNGEIMGYESRTDNGNGTYDLNLVHRALLDTTFQDHAVGDAVFFLNETTNLSSYTNADTGTLYYQLLSFTATQAQVLGDFPTQQLVRNQRYDRPLPPDLMEVEGLRAPIEVLSVTDVDITAYLERNRVTPEEVVLLADSADTPEASTTYTARLYLDGTLLATSTSLTHAGLPHNLAGLSGTGLGRVELEAVRAVGASWTVDWAEFFYANYLSLSAERLTNPGFESGLTGWTNVSGTWTTTTTVYPLDAVRVVGASSDDDHLQSTGGGTNERRQDYTIPGADDGKSALLRVYKGGLGSATGQIILEIRDGGGPLKTVTTTLAAATTVGKWELIEIPFSLRTAATIVRVRVVGTGAGSVWDNISLKNHTTSPISTLTYDTVTGVTPQGIWALRKAHSTYAGAVVRLRDTFDDTEQDVGFDTDGNLDAFWVRGQARVVTWYDQSGNGVNLNAASPAKQPRLLWNLTETGRPYVDFFGGCALRDPTAGTTRPYMTTRPNVVMAIGPKRDSSAAFVVTIPHQDASHSSPFYRWGLATAGTDYRWSVDGTEENDAGNTAINSGKHVVLIDYQNGNFYESNDATAADTFTAANITYPNSTRLRIGEDAAAGNPWTGTLSELCIYDGNVANGDRQTIMEGVSAYWYNFTA